MHGSKHSNFEKIGKKKRHEHGGKSFSRGCHVNNEHDAGKRAKRITYDLHDDGKMHEYSRKEVAA